MIVYSKHIPEYEKNVQYILENVHKNKNKYCVFLICFPILKKSSSIQKMFVESKNVNEFETGSYI